MFSPQPVRYALEVRTGDAFGAGTNAAVTIELLGGDGEWCAEISRFGGLYRKVMLLCALCRQHSIPDGAGDVPKLCVV